MTYRMPRGIGIAMAAAGVGMLWGGLELADRLLSSPWRWACVLMAFIGFCTAGAGIVQLCEKVEIKGDEVHWTDIFGGSGYIHRAYIDDIKGGGAVRILNKDGDWIKLPTTGNEKELARELMIWWKKP